MSTTHGIKHETDGLGQGPVAKKLCREISLIDHTEGYDLYMAGRTGDEDEGEIGHNMFLQVLKGKKIKDVCWMKEGWLPRGKGLPVRAYILFGNGKLRQWGTDDANWWMQAHHTRRIQKIPILTQVTRVVCGCLHTAAVTSNGSLFTWGLNSEGQLGRTASSDDDISKPATVENLNGIVIEDAACAAYSTFALDKDGNIYSWGYHEKGISGQGLLSGHSSTPTQIKQVPPCKQIAARHISVAALTKDGKVYTWGSRDFSGHFNGNRSDEEDEEEETHIVVPTRLEGALSEKTIVQIACGNCHTMALTDTGTVYAWGRNGTREVLGSGDSYYEDDTISYANFRTPTLAGSLEDEVIESISCGGDFTFALSKSSVHAWGANENGQLGFGIDEEKVGDPHKVPQVFHGKVVKVIAIEHHSAVLVDPRQGGTNGCPSAASILEGLFNNPLHADVEFTRNGEVICFAHRSILCARSEYFKAMFHNNEMMEARQKQFPVQYSKDIFMMAMKFIYGLDLYEDTKPEHLLELVEVADFYCLDDLKNWCHEALHDELTLETVGILLQIVFHREFKKMEEICMTFLVANAKEWTSNKALRQQVTSVELWERICEAIAHNSNDD